MPSYNWCPSIGCSDSGNPNLIRRNNGDPFKYQNSRERADVATFGNCQRTGNTKTSTKYTSIGCLGSSPNASIRYSAKGSVNYASVGPFGYGENARNGRV